MVVECFYGWNRSDLDSTVVKVWDVARVPINKDVNGTESQSLIVYIHFVEDDRRFSFRGILPKELDAQKSLMYSISILLLQERQAFLIQAEVSELFSATRNSLFPY